MSAKCNSVSELLYNCPTWKFKVTKIVGDVKGKKDKIGFYIQYIKKINIVKMPLNSERPFS